MSGALLPASYAVVRWRPAPARRRARLLALSLIAGLGASATAYVALAADEPVPTEPLYETGSTFIPPVDLGPAEATRKPRPRAREKTPAPTPGPEPVVEPGSPRRLIIPTLGVDSEIVPITARGGTLTPPDDGQEVGWWSPGAKPGAETGSALLTGHTFSRGGAALQDLENLEIGDRMAVGTPTGTIEYRVRDDEIFSKGTVAAQAPSSSVRRLPVGSSSSRARTSTALPT